MNKRVLITGIAGFTGIYLAELLRNEGAQIHGIVNHADAAHVSQDILHPCDLTDAKGLARVVEQVQPHWVVHLAGVTFVAHGDVEQMYRVNLLGTRHLLEALANLPARPEAVLLASSANVYGNGTEGVMDEATPPQPANDYAVSKLAMEYLARLYATQLPIVITRPFNYTGVGQSETFLLPKIVAHVRRGASIIELGNLDVARDFSDVRLVVQSYAKLLETPEAIGQTFNVCSGKAHTLAQVLDLVRELTGRDFNVRVNPAFVRQNEVKILLGSRARLDACIGQPEVIELRETLRWMLGDVAIASSSA